MSLVRPEAAACGKFPDTVPLIKNIYMYVTFNESNKNINPLRQTTTFSADLLKLAGNSHNGKTRVLIFVFLQSKERGRYLC